MKKYEGISYNGAITLRHTLRLNEIKFGDYVSLTPYGTYTKTRPSAGRTLQEPNETWSFSLSSFRINRITIPGLEAVVKDQVISGNYNYSNNIRRNPLNTAEITRETTSQDASASLYYATKDNVINGSLGVSARGSNTRDRALKFWDFSWSPAFTMNYIFSQDNPMTIWDWVPLIGGKVFKFEQKLNLGAVLSCSFNRGRTSTGVENDTAVYTASISGNYNILQNLKATSSVAFSYNKDNKVDNNSYKQLDISMMVDLEF
jgi:hypothetical protein